MDLLRKYLLANVTYAPETGAGAEESQGGDPIPVIVEAPADTPKAMSVHEAARTLAKAKAARREAAAAVARPPESQQAAAQAPLTDLVEDIQPTKTESTPTGDDAAVVEAQPPGETEGADPVAEELPPIEPPRSWTKADKELFAGLPRETQERLAERERSRDTDFSRRQQAADDKLKGLTAKEQAVEQARTQYETALPQILAQLQAVQAGEFADIKTYDDVEKLAREDYPRYIAWDVSQKKLAFMHNQVQEAQHRQQTERQQKFAAFAETEDKAFIAAAPDMADPKKAAELQKQAVATLKAIGFDEAELIASWQGQKDLSLRDHRTQLLIRDATKWRDAQAKAKTVQAKPVPPVQRPSVPAPKGAAQAANVENLLKRVETTSGMGAVRAAAEALRARRAAR